jgi:5-methylcytosine-specific restriction endonuclease McrA
MLLSMLADGRLHLSGIARLAPHLTRENRDAVLAQAAHKSKRQIEELVATLSPRPDAPAVIRKLPGRRTATGTTADHELVPDRVALPAPAPARPATVEPIAPSRYKVQFTASAGLRDKLARLQALMRSSVPDGDLAVLIEDAVTEKLQRLEARRFGRTEKPRHTVCERKTASDAASETAPSSRHIPAAVRRAVRERDGDRCRYVDAQGRRCTARDRLEFHHRHPFGHGGDHAVENLCLLCRAHNAYLAEADYSTHAVGHSRARSA